MNGFYYIFLIRQDLQDYRDIFCLHQFPEEIDETQATFGGKKKPRIIDIPLFNLDNQNLSLFYRNHRISRRRRLGILCFIRKQRIKKSSRSCLNLRKYKRIHSLNISGLDINGYIWYLNVKFEPWNPVP